MVQVPVQNARRTQLAHIAQFQPQRPRLKAQRRRDANQSIERRAFQRKLEALTQRRKIGAVAVVVGHYGEAGQTAFCGLGLDQSFQVPGRSQYVGIVKR